jgi:hypothetical protein
MPCPLPPCTSTTGWGFVRSAGTKYSTYMCWPAAIVVPSACWTRSTPIQR